jgi:hypothetical protein
VLLVVPRGVYEVSINPVIKSIPRLIVTTSQIHDNISDNHCFNLFNTNLMINSVRGQLCILSHSMLHIMKLSLFCIFYAVEYLIYQYFYYMCLLFTFNVYLFYVANTKELSLNSKEHY